jgi:hypothetical protein
MNHRLVVLSSAIVLSSCTTQTYLPPTNTQAAGSPVATITLQRNLAQPIQKTWNNLLTYAQQDGITVKQQNKNQGRLVLTLGTNNPERYMDCGAVEVQGGSFTTYRQFLEYVTTQADTILTVTIDIELKATSPTQTKVSVNANYDLQVGGVANPNTGVVTKGTQYRFDSKGTTAVTMPNPTQGMLPYSSCQSTGVAEQDVLDAAGGT